MKKIALFFLIFFSTQSFAEIISIVNIDYIISSSTIGKKMQSDLIKKNKDLTNKFQLEEKRLKNLENSIISKKNVISKDQFNNELNNLKNEINNYNLEKKKTLQDYNDYKKEIFLEIYKKINYIISEYAKENEIETVIDKKYIIMTKSTNEITQEILKKVNNQYD